MCPPAPPLPPVNSPLALRTTPLPTDQYLNDNDTRYLRQAFVWANAARTRGNRPFGAIVVAASGRLLAEAFSNTRETGDSTGHAEMNAVRQLANPLVSREVLATATLYSSAEPCAMCAAAICSAGIGRVVYGLDAERLHHIRPDLRATQISADDVFSSATYEVECLGPCLISEALAVYEDSWYPPG